MAEIRPLLLAVILACLTQISPSLAPGADPAPGADLMRIYDLAEVLTPVNDFPAPALGVSADTPEPAPTATPDTAALLARVFEPALLARLHVETGLRASTLVVNGSEELHGEIERVLAAHRARAKAQFLTTANLYLMSPERRASGYTLPALAWQRRAGDSSYAVTDDAQADQLIRSLAHDVEVIDFPQPNVISFSGQRCEASTLMQGSFLRLRFDEHGRAIAPDTLTTGSTMQRRATLSEDRATIHLEIDRRNCRLLEFRRIPVGDNHADEPVLWHNREAVDCTIPIGRAVVIATGTYLDPELPPRVGFLIVRCQLVDLDRIEAAAPRGPAPGGERRRQPTPDRATPPPATGSPAAPAGGATEF